MHAIELIHSVIPFSTRGHERAGRAWASSAVTTSAGVQWFLYKA